MQCNFLTRSLVGISLMASLGLAVLSTSASAQTTAALESPAPGSFQKSGVSLIRGWVCQASRVEVSIDEGPLVVAAYGTKRQDTEAACGDSNNGFGLTVNWNTVGEGAHHIRAFADGIVFAEADFVVTTLGRGFITDLVGEFILRNFPTTGNSPKIKWSDPDQNFVITNDIPVPENPEAPSNPRAALESPTQGSSQSGVGLIRGWVCDARQVEISVDDQRGVLTAYGAPRSDTEEACGDRDNGFGLTVNWNDLGDGVHNVRAFADGVEFANVNFAVATFGSSFLTGLNSRQTLAEFPTPDDTTTLTWSESDQNFVIAKTTATQSKIGILSFITDVFNRFAVASIGTEFDDVLGVTAAKADTGAPTQLTGLAWANSNLNDQADVQLTADGLPATYRDSEGTIAQFSDLTTTAMTVRFVDAQGNTRGQPVRVSINADILQVLRNIAQRIATNAGAQSAAAKQGYSRVQTTGTTTATGQQLAAAGSAPRFTTSPLLINAQWYGGLSLGEILCAVQTAGAQTGLLSQIATRGCQATLIKAFRERANVAQNAQAQASSGNAVTTALTAPVFSADSADIPGVLCGTDGCQTMPRKASSDPAPTARQVQDDLSIEVADPVAQQALEFSADIPEAPCAATATSAECLNPVAAILQAREETGPPILPSSPKILTSYTGSTEICFTATAEFGNRGVCTKCVTGSDVAAVFRDNGTLLIKSYYYTYGWGYDETGNCLLAEVNLGDPFWESPITPDSDGSFTHSVNISDGVIIGTLNLTGHYDPSSISVIEISDYSISNDYGTGSIVHLSRIQTLHAE
ncbi:MAG: hypothetical protein H6975_01365 [Gammaproteobacteria bacterium]|nr:hypothetical protein [Gammaproteobacteria bacterium]